MFFNFHRKIKNVFHNVRLSELYLPVVLNTFYRSQEPLMCDFFLFPIAFISRGYHLITHGILKSSLTQFGIVLLAFQFSTLLFILQMLKTVLITIIQANEAVASTPSIQTVQVPSVFSVTKQRLVGGGLCSRRDWTALLTSISTGLTTKLALVAWMGSFGLDWTKYTALLTAVITSFVLIWKTCREIQPMPSTMSLRLAMRQQSTNWTSEITRVSFRYDLFKMPMIQVWKIECFEF